MSQSDYTRLLTDAGVTAGLSARDALLPYGWNEPWRLERIRAVSKMGPEELLNLGDPRGEWHPGYEVIPVSSVEEHDLRMGTFIASYIVDEIKQGNIVVAILPVGPMGQYARVADMLCDQLSPDELNQLITLNMDEWKYPAGEDGGESFKDAMHRALFDQLAEYGYDPESNSAFATDDVLPGYRKIIEEARSAARRRGVECKILLVHGIGQACHIAFVEPHLAAIYPDEAAWRKIDYLMDFPLCTMTLEQNAITSFRSNALGPAYLANTIGPGIYLEADQVIGGCDGALMQSPYEGFSMTWQAQAIHMTLGWGEPDICVPSSMLPFEMPGKLFVIADLLEPLSALSH